MYPFYYQNKQIYFDGSLQFKSNDIKNSLKYSGGLLDAHDY